MTSAVGSSDRLTVASPVGGDAQGTTLSGVEAEQLGERVLDTAREHLEVATRRAVADQRRSAAAPQYDRIATLRVRFRDSGTIGYTSSMRAPRQ